MEENSQRIAQYAAYGAARLHFSRLFFQTVAVVLGLLLAAGFGLRDLAEPLRSWCLVGGGLALVQAAFITARLQHQEHAFERLLHAIEAGFGGELRQPASSRFGAKTSVVASLLLLGVLLAGMGAIRLFGAV